MKNSTTNNARIKCITMFVIKCRFISVNHEDKINKTPKKCWMWQHNNNLCSSSLKNVLFRTFLEIWRLTQGPDLREHNSYVYRTILGMSAEETRTFGTNGIIVTVPTADIKERIPLSLPKSRRHEEKKEALHYWFFLYPIVMSYRNNNHGRPNSL